MDGGTDYSNKQTDTPTVTERESETDCDVSSAPVTGYDYWLNDDDDYDDNDDDDDDTCFLPAHLRGRGAEKAAGSAATSAPTATCGAKRRSPFGFRPTREGGGGGGGTN